MSDNERPLFRSAVFVAAINEQGEVLLQQRQNTGFLDGYWDLSGTGHVEYDESFESCAVRELAEETSLQIDAHDLELLLTYQTNFEPGIYYINTIYRAKKWRGQVGIGEPTKIAELKWFHIDHFPEKLTVGARVFLTHIGSHDVKNYYIDSKEYRTLMGEKYV